MLDTIPKYAIPDQLNVNSLSSTNKSAYTLISSNGSNVWKLPIPISLDYNSEYKWSAEELHHLAAGILGGIQNFENWTKNPDSKFTDTVSKLNSLKDSLLNYTSNVSNKLVEDGFFSAVSEAGNNTLGRSLKQKLLKATTSMLGGSDTNVKEYYKNNANGSIAYNPNEQLYFDGVSLRDFSMSFSLSPVSSQEANQIKSGFRNLARAAAPSFTENGYYFTYPSYFEITVIISGITLLQRKGLAITSLNCNLTSDGPLTWHDDGMPTSLQLDISFKENVVPTKDNLANITFLGSKL